MFFPVYLHKKKWILKSRIGGWLNTLVYSHCKAGYIFIMCYLMVAKMWYLLMVSLTKTVIWCWLLFICNIAFFVYVLLMLLSAEKLGRLPSSIKLQLVYLLDKITANWKIMCIYSECESALKTDFMKRGFII